MVHRHRPSIVQVRWYQTIVHHCTSITILIQLLVDTIVPLYLQYFTLKSMDQQHQHPLEQLEVLQWINPLPFPSFHHQLQQLVNNNNQELDQIQLLERVQQHVTIYYHHFLILSGDLTEDGNA